MRPTPISVSSLRVRGFKSIRDAELKLGLLNVLIGPNGAGKSNLVDWFRMIAAMMRGDLQLFVARSGGASTLLHHGPKVTEQMEMEVVFHPDNWEKCVVEFGLSWSADDTLFFRNQKFWVSDAGKGIGQRGYSDLDGGARECVLTRPDFGSDEPAPHLAREFLSRWRIYHFDDTSPQAAIRSHSDVATGANLRGHGENLAAFLHHLRDEHPPYYQRIVATVGQVAPFFRDFSLVPTGGRVSLNWRSRDSEYEFGPHQLSDGTLRFIAMATLFLQPEQQLPRVIVLDEPELGLHPFAIQVLAGLARACSHHSQVVISTQSTALLDQFEPEEVIVTEQSDGQSRFHRLDPVRLQEWLEAYSLSDLWQKNVLGGRPAR